MIAVHKLDGSVMYLNQDLIERVEDGADGQSAVYLINGGRIIVANDSAEVVEKIRSEKVVQLLRVRQGPHGQLKVTPTHTTIAEVPILSQVTER